MKTPSDESPVNLLKAAGVWPLSAYHVHGLMMALLALCPVIVCAIFAEHSGRWDLFQRSGSITSAIGLFIASRRYIQFSLLELLQANDHLKTNKAELLYDINAAKLGLALSGFGTVVGGWGQYLGWWSFGYLVIWALFVIRDAHRDLKRARDGLR